MTKIKRVTRFKSDDTIRIYLEGKKYYELMPMFDPNDPPKEKVWLLSYHNMISNDLVELKDQLKRGLVFCELCDILNSIFSDLDLLEVEAYCDDEVMMYDIILTICLHL